MWAKVQDQIWDEKSFFKDTVQGDESPDYDFQTQSQTFFPSSNRGNSTGRQYYNSAGSTRPRVTNPRPDPRRYRTERNNEYHQGQYLSYAILLKRCFLRFTKAHKQTAETGTNFVIVEGSKIKNPGMKEIQKIHRNRDTVIGEIQKHSNKTIQQQMMTTETEETGTLVF